MVAEGIETLEDWRLLQRYGCNVGQGYLIAKPMPASELPSWLRSHKQRLPELQVPAVQSSPKAQSPQHNGSGPLKTGAGSPS